MGGDIGYLRQIDFIYLFIFSGGGGLKFSRGGGLQRLTSARLLFSVLSLHKFGFVRLTRNQSNFNATFSLVCLTHNFLLSNSS